jgi:hypothetical protein
MLIKIINVVAFALMVLMNYLANALPLNNKTTGQLSDQYPNLFVPAGVTFSIWGVIYLMLLGFCLIQFRDQNKGIVFSIEWAFAISCLLNALWIVAWHYEQLPLSLLVMLGLLAILILINISLRTAPTGLIKAAFGIYLGWICIATIANVTALLVNYNWGGWGVSHETWTIIMILAGAIISILAITRFQNPFIGLAVVWAFIGIILKRQEDIQSIVIVALIGIVMVAVVTGWIFLRTPASYTDFR